jgi:hypothetical protein
MALTATDIQTRIDQLQKVRDSGTLTLRHGDTQTTFRSLDELNRTLQDLYRQLNAVNGTKRSKVNYVKQRTKGFGRDPLRHLELGRDWK